MSESAAIGYDATMGDHRKTLLTLEEKAFSHSKKIEERNLRIMRRRQHQCLHYHLRMAHVLLLCAEEAEPGPGRISALSSAYGRIDNARRYAVIFKLNLRRRIARLLRRYKLLSRVAGEGEAIGPAFEGEVHIVSRDANGRWSERRERVH